MWILPEYVHDTDLYAASSNRSSGTLKKENRTRIHIRIIHIRRQLIIVPIHHSRRPHDIQIIHIQTFSRRSVVHENSLLTRITRVRRIRTLGVVVVEKRIQPCAIHKNITGSQDAQTPCHGTIRWRTRRAESAEIRIVQCSILREWLVRRRVGLVVRRFGLDLTHEDILRAGKLILVSRMVFHRGADQPECAGRAFDVESATGVDVYLRQGGILDVVICGPEPDILHVQPRGGFRDVHAHVGG